MKTFCAVIALLALAAVVAEAAFPVSTATPAQMYGYLNSAIRGSNYITTSKNGAFSPAQLARNLADSQTLQYLKGYVTGSA